MNVGIIGLTKSSRLGELTSILTSNGNDFSIGSATVDDSYFNATDCVVVLIGDGLSGLTYIDEQIVMANRHGKSIVGIYVASDVDPANIPPKFEEYGNVLICWDITRIIPAIKGEINDWDDPDCSKRDGGKSKKRHDC